MISALRMKTNPAILDALRLRTKDLEIAQESFSAVWNRYDFRVKTFQEGLGLTGVNFGPFGKKVVPDDSSLLGDVRERAETIQANHMEMCRFTGLDDPNYERLCGEITEIYDWLAGLNATTVHRIRKRSLTVSGLATSSHESRAGAMSESEKTCLQSLLFPNMNQRIRNLENPAEGTCSWFFEHEHFIDWITGKNQAQSCGLLWVKGKPGSGKSTLLKEAFSRATIMTSSSECHVMSFFFNAKGEGLEHSPTGMLRSIVHQMCSQNSDLLGALMNFAQSRRALCGEDMAPWEEAELRAFFTSVIASHKERIIIFVNAIDECDSNSMRDVADFWREITNTAYGAGVQLSVCLSSRHFPAITINDCPIIIVDNHNYAGIVEFVGRRLDYGMGGKREDRDPIREKILEKSGGVFLWVSLVVKNVLRKADEGKGLKSLLHHLDSVPRELEDLFCQLLTAAQSSGTVVRMFQWALLPAKPLRLHEWHHILAFIGDTPPSSLHQWRQSDYYTETDDQLEKRITHLSRGLLGFNTSAGDILESGDDSMSDRADAGSLDLNTGETRVVQVIHESVRQYFLKGTGFAVLRPEFATKPLAHAHHSIMIACLYYIYIEELDALVEARGQASDRSKRNWHDEWRDERSHNMEIYWTHSTPYFTKLYGSLRSTLQASPKDTSHEPHQSTTPTRLGSPASVASFGSAGSHEGRQSPFALEPEGCSRDKRNKRRRLSDSPSPASPRLRRKVHDISAYEILKESSSPIQAYDVASWRSRDVAVIGQDCFDEFATHASPSVTGCSEVLEDYPALLSYATFRLFRHAQKADAENLDPTYIIQLLQNLEFWSRWKALREDIGPSIGLLDFVVDLGLSSWLKAEGFWDEAAVLRAIKRAIKFANSRALSDLLGAFPSIGYAKQGGVIARLSARATSTALLEVYISHHPSQEPSSNSSVMVLRELLNSKDEDDRSALHLAVTHQNMDSVSVLLKHGADADDVGPGGMTALHLACGNTLRLANSLSSDRRTGNDVLAPRSDIIQLLLDREADIDAIDRNGRTPLMVACIALRPQQDTGEEFASTGAQSEGEDYNAVEVLLKRGANALKRGFSGSLPLHEACWNSSGGFQSKVLIVRKLLDYGSPVNAVENKLGTPLHFACCCSDIAIVEELLRWGADPLMRDYNGSSPLHIAAGASTEKVVEALLSLPGLFVDTTDNSGWTPLHVACHVHPNANQGRATALSVIRRLLAHGAKAYTLRNHEGNSPADVARIYGFKDALELLAEKSCDAPSLPFPKNHRNRSA